MFRNIHCRLFFYAPFCAYLHVQLANWRSYKDTIPNKRLLYYRRYLFSVVELDKVMVPNTHRSFFPISHLSALTYLTWKLRVIYGRSSKWLLYYRSHSSCGLELQERSNSRATAPDTHRSFSDTTLYAYTTSPCIHHYLVRNYAWQQSSRTQLMTAYLHTKRRLYC